MTTNINTSPVFTKNGIILPGKTISAANTAKDGTGTVITIFDPSVTASTLTSSGTTATFISTVPHNFVNGDTVLIVGASTAGYNGIQTITSTGALSFTYTVASGLATPDAGAAVAHPMNGTRISKVVWQPIGTNVASVGRVFLNNGQANSSATNNVYLADITLPVSTLSEVASMSQSILTLELVVPPFHKLNTTLGTAVAAGYAVYAVAGAY